jgi:predicted RNA-binding Zn ribbon-like protein
MYRPERKDGMIEHQGEPIFELVGGWLCLDFTNTANYGSEENRNDRLKSYADLVLWSQLVGTLTPEGAQHLGREAERRPTAAMAADRQPTPADLANLNAALAKMLAQSQLVPTKNGFAWTWTGDATALERLIWPIAWSATELLTSDNLRRVGECAGHNCGWLFLDTSRNHSRRWCNMRECGNRAKARRHYRRRRLVKTARA